MLKRLSTLFTTALFTTSLLLSACSGQTNAPVHSGGGDFKAQLKKDYPVSLANIADGVWVYSTNHSLPGLAPIASNGLVVADGDELTLVDTAWGELATLALLETIKDETGKNVTKLVITNHNIDRIAGVDAAEHAGIQVFTHPDTPALAAKHGYPVPNTSVAALKEPKSRTKLGAVELAFPGHGYTADNLVVYVPAANVLFAGGAVRSVGSKGMGNLEDADLKTWGPALAWVKATYPDTKIVVPSRGKGANLSLIDGTMALIAQQVNADGDADKEKSDGEEKDKE